MSAPSTPLEVPFGPSGTVVLRKMVLDEDAPLLHDWFSRDYARFWGLQGKTVDEIREKFAGIEASGLRHFHHALLFGCGCSLLGFCVLTLDNAVCAPEEERQRVLGNAVPHARGLGGLLH